MSKHLNNKGYMLVEIILAFVLAMGVAYFITELTIKLKNKNDDLLVKTLVATDQAIIYNTIMRDLYDDSSNFDCDDIILDDNVFKYKTFTNIVSEYAEVGSVNCSNVDGKVTVNIPISVKQLPDENFNVVISDENNIPDSEHESGSGEQQTYTCSKSANKNINSTVNCSDANFEQQAASCLNYYYESSCSRTPALYSARHAECSYDEFSRKYVWRTNNLIPLTTGLSSCTAEVSDGITTCTYEQSISGGTRISSCIVTKYNYSGTITCYSYSCSQGTRSGNKCYLYNQTSCPSGWTVS